MKRTRKRSSAALAVAAFLGAAALPLGILASPAMAGPEPVTIPAVVLADDVSTAPHADEDYINAVTPPMGYNNWAHNMCNINEQFFRDQADAIVAKGLASAGYDTVTVDDCWMQKDRDANGDLQTRSETFPSGMKALGDYIHGKGLKYGLYQDSGTVTCSGGDYAGSWGHFDADMKLFAKFGVDYVKMDGCNVPSVAGETKEETYKRIYFEEAAAIKNSGRPMVLSNSAPAYFSIPNKLPAWYSVMDWSGEMSQLWRESWDINVYDTANPSTSRWAGIMRNYDYNKPIQRFASVGHWNDPDYIIGGNAGVTAIEGRTQLSLWSMMASPLILSTDVTAIPDSFLADLTNPGMLAIDQDTAGIQGTLVSSDGSSEVMYRPLADGSFAVSLFNRSGARSTVSTTAVKLGFAPGGSYEVTNVWTGATSTTNGDFSAILDSRATELLRVKPVAGAEFAGASGQIMATNETRCLDASAADATAGEAIRMANCNASEAQRFVRGAGKSLQVLGQCATVAGDGLRGSALVLAECTGAENQSLGYKKNGQLISDSAGLCMGTPSGTLAVLDTCGDNPLHQIFSVPGEVTDTVDPLPAVPPSGTNWLSDLAWTSASVGYGVVGIDAGVLDFEGQEPAPLTANYTDPATGKKPIYEKGLGVHASSTISYDLAGNCSAFSSDAFMQDPFAGTVVFSVWSDGVKRWTSTDVTAGTAPQNVSIDVTGANTLELRVDPPAGGGINGAHGSWGSPQIICADADTEIPVTNAQVSGTPSDSGWYTATNTTLTLTATDNDRIASTEYRLNGGEWTAFTAPVVMDEGETVVDFRSTDATGNREPAKSLPVKVDSQAPVLAAVVADRSVTVTASDSGSGIASVEFSSDSGLTWQEYTDPIKGGESGVSIAYRASDVAGLTAVSVQDAVVAPVTPPVTTEPPVTEPTDPATTPPASETPTAPATTQPATTSPGTSSGNGDLASTGATVLLPAGIALLLLLGGAFTLVVIRRRNRA